MNILNKWKDNNAFLGCGWSFPPEITDKGTKMSAYEKDIKESLYILFSTSPGERVNRYDYGCPLRLFTFEPLTRQTVERMRNAISRSVVLYEPRIVLEDITIEDEPDMGRILIKLTYTIIRTNNRNNMVYPFYINEGTSLKK